MLAHLDLAPLVLDTLQLVKPTMNKNLVFQVESVGEPSRIEADASQIRQVLMNLILNAGEAMENRPGVLRIRYGAATLGAAEARSLQIVPPENARGFAFVEVADAGVGISPENLKRIFDPFFTTKFAGRGLGLAAVQGIVRGHKGGLGVESEVGVGTTFRLFLPIYEQGVVAESPTSPPIHDLEEWRGKGRVLVVDDEDSVRRALMSMLTWFGLDAVAAASGYEAVRLFAESPESFGFVVLDLTMPGMDGAETFKELCRLRSNIPVLLISGYNMNEAAVRYAGLGIAGFLQKPFGVAKFKEAVRGIFRQAAES